MQLYHFDDVKQDYKRVKKYLLQSEAEHCLIFGTINTLINFPKFFTAPPYLVTAEADGILAVAIRTPPRKLILSRSLNSEAIKAIAQDLSSDSQAVPGLIAPNIEATTFVGAWQALTGHIYQTIGYQPVCDLNDYWFENSRVDIAHPTFIQTDE